MVVVAHADDAEYGCSGTVAKLCAEGWDMTYVLCTDGSKGSSDREISGQELSEARRKEQINAGKVLGLKDVAFLGYPDSYLEPSLSPSQGHRKGDKTVQAGRGHLPVPAAYTGRRVGRRTSRPSGRGEATLAAVFPTARDHMTFPELLEEGFEPHKVAEVWITGHPDPDVFIDVTDHMETAVKALAEHKSQTGGRPYEEMLPRMKEWRRRGSVGKGMLYSESFKRISFRW